MSCEDWRDHDSERLANTLLSNLHPGSILLLHDRLLSASEPRYFDRLPLVEALDKFLTRVGDRYRFVTIPELLRHGKPTRVNLYRKPNVDWLNELCEEDGSGRRYEPLQRGWLDAILS